MTHQRISQSPDPAKPGDTVRFCYDIDGASLPVTLAGQWDNGGAFQHTVTKDSDRCWDEVAPANATGGQVVDSTGQSADFEIDISP